jgi:hypothetical protein
MSYAEAFRKLLEVRLLGASASNDELGVGELSQDERGRLDQGFDVIDRLEAS